MNDFLEPDKKPQDQTNEEWLAEYNNHDLSKGIIGTSIAAKGKLVSGEERALGSAEHIK